jgi:hypothetical protein
MVKRKKRGKPRGVKAEVKKALEEVLNDNESLRDLTIDMMYSENLELDAKRKQPYIV